MLCLNLKSIENGEISLDDVVPCSEKAMSMGGSQIWLEPKDNLTVNLLLEKGLKQGEIASQMGISPNRAYYLIKDAKKLDLENIKNYIIKLAELDYKIKSGHVDPKKGFEVFLFSL